MPKERDSIISSGRGLALRVMPSSFLRLPATPSRSLMLPNSFRPRKRLNHSFAGAEHCCPGIGAGSEQLISSNWGKKKEAEGKKKGRKQKEAEGSRLNY